MKFLMYGAGSIGRGFIGPLFAHAGYEVVFVDVNKQIIDALNARRSYHYTIAADPPYNVAVTGIYGIDGADEQSVSEEIASCDLMATALGAAALQKVAPIIARGFSRRMKQNAEPLNLLICENLKDAPHLLRGWIEASLPAEDKPLLAGKFGLIEAAIARMVPVAVSDASDPLHVTVEEYGFLPVDKDAFIGEAPVIEGLIPYSPFAFYEERKLYLHNMGHAICAYLGRLQGYETIARAISDPYIRHFVQSAMTESAAMLSVKYNVPFSRIFDNAEDLLLRFGNSALGDTCERVGRDPMRKIARDDRLAGALAGCKEYSVYPVYIGLGYASALRSLTHDVQQAERLAIENGGLDREQANLVLKLYKALDLPMPELSKYTERIKKEMRGNIV